MAVDLKKYLRVGERVDLRVERSTHRSVVQDIPTQDNLLALHPLDRRNLPIHLDHDQLIDTIYFRDNGQYVIAGVLLGRSRLDNVPVVRILATAEPVRIQRRMGYRLSRRIPVVLHPLNPSIQLQEEYHSHTVDISEGGMQVSFPTMVGLGTVFEVQFAIELEGVYSIQLRTSVCRMFPPEDSGRPWRLGMRFLDIPEEARRKISRYIIQEQIKQRILAPDGE